MQCREKVNSVHRYLMFQALERFQQPHQVCRAHIHVDTWWYSLVVSSSTEVCMRRESSVSNMCYRPYYSLILYMENQLQHLCLHTYTHNKLNFLSLIFNFVNYTFASWQLGTSLQRNYLQFTDFWPHAILKAVTVISVCTYIAFTTVRLLERNIFLSEFSIHVFTHPNTRLGTQLFPGRYGHDNN